MIADTGPARGEGTLANVLLEGPRPAPPGAVAASVTLGWRALLKIKHLPFQLFDVTVFPIMSTLLFTYLFGGALAGSPREYAQYLLPGIVVQTIVFITVYTGMGLNADIQKGLFDRFRSLPIWQPAPVVGALLGDVLRYALAATVILLLGLILGFRPQGGIVGVVAAVALVITFAVSVSWMWIIVGMVSQTPESVMTNSFIFLFPLTFASDIFVDPATMPGWLAAFVGVNPVTHVAAASRGIMHGQVPWTSVLWVLATSAVFTAVFAPLALRMYARER